MNQIEAAQKAGVGREHLNALINGRKNPSRKLAIRLEQVTGVTREIWVFGSPEERRAAWRKAKETQR